MTPRKLRARLALLLGLPLIPACKEAPPPESPRVPVDAKPAKGVDVPDAAAPTQGRARVDGRLRCALDEVHEFVCGRIDKASHDPKAGAAAPFEACTTDASALTEFDDFLFVDSSRVGRADPVLESFTYDAKRTQAYHYRGTVLPDDTFCCYERCAPLPIAKAPRGAVPPGLFVQEKCIPAPESGPSKPAKGAAACPESVRLAIDTRENPGPFDDAPFAHTDDDPSRACCYSVATPRRCPTDMYESNGDCHYPTRGRPLRDGDALVTAPAVARADFTERVRLDLDTCDESVRARAAAAWTREGAAEHASIAAFARLTLDLMAVGAPAALVEDVCRATRDEVRHAALAYGLASAFGGSEVGPGPIALLRDRGAMSLPTLAVECFVDGCVEETVAAMCAAEARAESALPQVTEALAVIVDDETRHAELAYRILAWTLEADEDGAVHRALSDALAAQLRREHAARRGAAHEDAADALTALGILTAERTARVRARVLDEVVFPTVSALIARASRPAISRQPVEQA